MGARFTWTSKMLKKMLRRFSVGLSGFATTTLPSAGETAPARPG
jgi:hypothetical protein